MENRAHVPRDFVTATAIELKAAGLRKEEEKKGRRKNQSKNRNGREEVYAATLAKN
jgi:hypothetical protein